MEMVTTFDVNLLQGMSVGVFPLRHVTVVEVEAALKMMSPGGAAAGRSPDHDARARPGLPATGWRNVCCRAAGRRQQQRGVRTESVPRRHPRDADRRGSTAFWSSRPVPPIWKRRGVGSSGWTSPATTAWSRELFVYPVQNGLRTPSGRSAERRSSVMARATLRNEEHGIGPGIDTDDRQHARHAERLPALRRQPSRPARTRQHRPGTRSSASTLASGVRVVRRRGETTPSSSTLPGSLTRKSSRASRRLDVPPTQVLIEASIVEVTLTDGLEYGLQWFFNDKSRTGLTGTGVLSNIDGGAAGRCAAGLLVHVAQFGG